jgi:hypothetical protein
MLRWDERGVLVLDLLVDILERGRDHDSFPDREGEAVGLTRSMVRAGLEGTKEGQRKESVSGPSEMQPRERGVGSMGECLTLVR